MIDFHTEKEVRLDTNAAPIIYWEGAIVEFPIATGPGFLGVCACADLDLKSWHILVDYLEEDDYADLEQALAFTEPIYGGFSGMKND